METAAIETFVKTFIRKDKRSRWLTLLASAKGRRRLVAMLDHGYDFDSRWAQSLGSDVSGEEVARILKKSGAGPTCFLISSNRDLDGQDMGLTEALEQVVGHGFGTYVICKPERLAYFESEDAGRRFLLSRRLPDPLV